MARRGGRGSTRSRGVRARSGVRSRARVRSRRRGVARSAGKRVRRRLTMSQARKRNARARERRANQSDGQTAGYYARRNGKTVFVAGYNTPDANR